MLPSAGPQHSFALGRRAAYPAERIGLPMLQTISIAAPAYNEGENISVLVEEWMGYLGARFKAQDFEIVVCDDGSRDETWEILSDLARAHPSLKPCRHGVNQGAAAALTTAIRRTTKGWVLLLDADGQYPIDNLEAFMRELEREPSAAFIGCRPQKEDSAFARFGSWASGACCNFFHGTRYRDFNCALKLVEGDLLRGLCLEAKGLNYSTEISSKILERGVAMREVEIIHRARAKGRSSRTLLRGSLHRLLFVAYIGFRQGLFKWGLLQRSPYHSP
jgi:dolichol-phosphate mannosyltransferase